MTWACRAPVQAPARGSSLRVTVTNASAVPQYQLQVYALGLAGGRFVEAGRTTGGHLGTESTEKLPLTLFGYARARSIELEALPTMFQ